MAQTVYNRFNRGVVDKLALTRGDVEKVVSTAAVMDNWMPVRLGPMSVAPGFQRIGDIPGEAILLPFVRSIEQTALLELTDQLLRVWFDDALITRPDPDTASLAALSAWTDASSGSGSTTTSGAGAEFQSAPNLELGIRHANITSATTDFVGVRFTVSRGVVRVKIGTSGVGSVDIDSVLLGNGVHSLLIPADATTTITIESTTESSAIVDSVVIEAAGVMTLPTEILEASLVDVRFYQIADRVFLATDVGQFVIERRGDNSWSIVVYETSKGPWGFVNSTDLTLAPSSRSGDCTITASDDYFVAGDVGRIVRIASASQTQSVVVTTTAASTGNIRVSGSVRTMNITTAGGFTGTINLEQSPDESTWTTVQTYADDVGTQFSDEVDGGVYYYRLTSASDFSGTGALVLYYGGGGTEGCARLVAYNSATSMDAAVCQQFGAAAASRDWYISQWSDTTGWPSAVGFSPGRLVWAGNDKVWASESDNYYGFDRLREGAAKSILRTIGFGPVDSILWVSAAREMMLGLPTDEVTFRSSSFGEVLTQDNAQVKEGAGMGSANIQPASGNNTLYMINRSARRLMEVIPDGDGHILRDLNYLNQDIGRDRFTRLAMTRDPEMRVYGVLATGQLAILLIDNESDVLAWSTRSLPDPVRDVCVLPSFSEDEVYAVCETDGGWALLKQGSCLDPHLYPVDDYADADDCAHLNGESVDVWLDGVRLQDAVTVSGGSVTASSGAIVGKRITAQYKSNRLGQYVDRLVDTERKRVTHIGLVLHDVLLGGLSIGQSFDALQALPLRNAGVDYTDDTVVDTIDALPIPFSGAYKLDSRVCIEANGPATIALMSITIDTPYDQTPAKR